MTPTWERFAACRLLDGHAWGRSSATRVKLARRGACWELSHKCMRRECRAARITQYSIVTGEIINRYYQYPSGYAIPTNNKRRRNSPILLRREYFRRHGRI